MNNPIPCNMTMTDRIIRIVLSLIMAGVIFYIPMNAVLAWILALLALILLVTGLVGYSYLYTLFKK